MMLSIGVEHDCYPSWDITSFAGRTIPTDCTFQLADTLWLAGAIECAHKSAIEYRQATADGDYILGELSSGGATHGLAEPALALRNVTWNVPPVKRM